MVTSDHVIEFYFEALMLSFTKPDSFWTKYKGLIDYGKHIAIFSLNNTEFTKSVFVCMCVCAHMHHPIR